MPSAVRLVVATTLLLAVVVIPAPVRAADARGDTHDARPDAVAACLDLFDLQQANETCSASLPLLVPDGYYGLVVQGESAGDRDWYRVTVGRNETLRAEIVFRTAPSASTLSLHSACAGAPIVQSTGAGLTRAVQYQNAGASASFWIQLATADAACLMYDMNVTRTCPDAFDPNESCELARPLTAGIYGNLWLGGSIVDQDFYSVHLLPQQRVVIDLAFVNAEGNLNTGLFTSCGGDLLAASFGTGDGEHFEYLNSGAAADFILLIDNQTNPACTPHTLTVAIDGGLNLDARETPPGWDFPTVPRASGDASYDTTRVSLELPGNQPSTWLNQYIENDGPVAMPAWTAMFLLDGAPLGGLQTTAGNTPGPYALQNFGPVTVRGGRHTLATRADYFNQVAEPDTSDNTFQRQFVWSPLPLARATPVTRAAPPPRGEAELPNCDGFRYTRDPAFAWVVASASTSASTCQPLMVCDDYAGSTSGFSHILATSSLCSWSINFVAGHFNATPQSLYPGVYAQGATAGSNFIVDVADSRERVGGPQASFQGEILPAQRLADVYEVWLPAGQTVTLVVRRRSGTADLRAELLPPAAASVWARGTGVAATAMTPDVDRLDHTAAATGYHPVVVYRDQAEAVDAAVVYDVNWSTTGAVAVDERPATRFAFSFDGAAPNPVSASARFVFTLPATAVVAIDIYDALGRHVRTLSSGRFGAGRHSVGWDRRDHAGTTAAAGVYWARLAGAGLSSWRRLVVLP